MKTNIFFKIWVVVINVTWSLMMLWEGFWTLLDSALRDGSWWTNENLLGIFFLTLSFVSFFVIKILFRGSTGSGSILYKFARIYSIIITLLLMALGIIMVLIYIGYLTSVNFYGQPFWLSFASDYYHLFGLLFSLII